MIPLLGCSLCPPPNKAGCLPCGRLSTLLTFVLQVAQDLSGKQVCILMATIQCTGEMNHRELSVQELKQENILFLRQFRGSSTI